jgi:3-phosphoshikimate 1-carboxyvinyltransferase
VKLVSQKASALHGVVRLPGDKSISHRTAILAASADGLSRIDGFLRAGVTQVMLDSLAAAGVKWQWEGETLVVEGNGRSGFRAGSQPLNCGNSGTTLRLLSGALAGRPQWRPDAGGGEFILDCSDQLRRRPMRRVIEPLREMGAAIRSVQQTDCAPLGITPSRLAGIEHAMPVASAQVKSAILLAGLSASGSTLVREPSPSRDHTERLLRLLGVRLEEAPCRVRVFPVDRPLPPLSIRVVGDFSSAAFLLVAALIVPGSEIILRDVGLNPRRTGLLDALRRMGADVAEVDRSEMYGEPRGDLRVRAGPLASTIVEGAEVVDMIDEFTVLAVAAACAKGITLVRGAAELRHKESDRISMLAAELRKIGVAVEETADGFSIEGPAEIRGGTVESHGDHRLAMALSVAGLVSKTPVAIEDAECVSESFPNFAGLMNSLGAQLA